MRGLNLDHVRAFTEVARLGTFSAAAEQLNLTQPAISQQIAQLERRLGVALVERLGRRATPTAAATQWSLRSCSVLERTPAPSWRSCGSPVRRSC